MFLLIFSAQFWASMLVWQLFCFTSLSCKPISGRGPWAHAATSAPKLESFFLVLPGQLCRHACAHCHILLIPSLPGALQGTHGTSRSNFARHCSSWTWQDCPGDPWVCARRWKKISAWKEKIFSLTYIKASLDTVFFFQFFSSAF